MQHLCITTLVEGFSASAGLIIAIGAQNAFVLKQGISKNHVLGTVLICAVLDATLIMIGIAGLGRFIASNSLLLSFARWGGAAFLGYYGLKSFQAVLKTESLTITEGKAHRPNLQDTITTALAFSLLNPHVYLDTIVLLGSIGAQFPACERFSFGIGAIMASFIWFFSLGFGACYLEPLFQKPIAWKVLDFIIGCVMWLIALSLVFGVQDIGCKA